MSKNGLGTKGCKKKAMAKCNTTTRVTAPLSLPVGFASCTPCQPTGGLSCIGKRKPKQRREACFLMKMMAAANGEPSAGREKSRSR